MEIGEDTFVNYECWFNTAGKITIGRMCNIAYKVTFITSTHDAYSARTAHPFQRNGAPFRFKLSKAQQVN